MSSPDRIAEENIENAEPTRDRVAETRSDLWTYPPQLGGLDVTGFDAQAVDGSLGRVDYGSYEQGMSFIVIDTRGWIPGKRLTLVPGGLIERVDRDLETVFLSPTKEQIENAPQYPQEGSSDAQYRASVEGYYDSDR